MAAIRQRSASRKNVRKRANAARQKKSAVTMPRQKKTSLGRQAAQARQQKRAV